MTLRRTAWPFGVFLSISISDGDNLYVVMRRDWCLLVLPNPLLLRVV